MKESYFQPDTIHSIANQWLEKYGKPNKERRQPFEIQRPDRIKLRAVRSETHAGKRWIDGRIYLPGSTTYI